MAKDQYARYQYSSNVLLFSLAKGFELLYRTPYSKQIAEINTLDIGHHFYVLGSSAGFATKCKI